MKLHKLEQGSTAWYEARSKEGLCLASQAAAVMNEGKFTPKNQEELLALKKGKIKIPFTPAMQHGNRYEPEARQWAEDKLSQTFEPASLTREIEGLTYWASLDGISFDGDVSIEIKCPYRGENSELWGYISRHKQPPIYYLWQLLHQQLVSQCPHNFFVVYDAFKKKGIFLEMDVKHFACRKEELRQGWRSFWERYYANEPVKPSFKERTDREWEQASSAWKEKKQKLNEALQAEKEARERLIHLAKEENSQGGGVKAKRYQMKGAIDYQMIPALEGVDLEEYRKPGRYQWRIMADDSE